MEALQKELRKLVTSGSSRNWKKAFDKILELDEAEIVGIVDDVYSLQTKFNRLAEENNRGTISDNDFEVGMTKMTRSFLGLIKDLGTEKATTPPPEPEPAPGEKPEPKTNILFLAANPMASGRLQLDKESREIKEAIRLSKNRDHIHFEKWEALRPKDLVRGLLEVNPNIIHFSGHGVTLEKELKAKTGTRGIDEDDLDEEVKQDLTNYSGGIMIQDEQDRPKIINATALAGLFVATEGKIDCVLLNACYSKAQADALLKAGIPAVIGMNDAVPDTTAITFATRFYDAIGAGKEIKTAFNVAKASLLVEGVEGADIPELMENGK